MRVLYHHRTQSNDGQAVHIRAMLRALRASGCELRVVEPAGAGASGAVTDGRPSLAGRLRRRLPRPLHELLELAYSLLSFVALWRAYRAFRPDVLYERYNLLSVSGVWLRRLTGLPLILEVNAPLFEERHANDGLVLPALARWSQHYCWQNADLVLPVTQVLADMVAAAGVPRDRITVVPNGIDPEDYAALPSREEAKRRLGVAGRTVLGFTGYVRAWHGLDGVLDLLARPEARDWVLVVVGDGPARADLERRAAALGVAERVRFTGVVGHAELPLLVAAFDVALQPAATAYASPLKLFEYMAARCAIVAPAQPNLLEVLTDNENALLFAPGDLEDMAVRIESLASDVVLRERLGAAASRTLDERGLLWISNARRVIALSESLVNGSNNSGGLGRSVRN